MESKRKSNTQGLLISYRGPTTINVRQLHNKTRFMLSSNNEDALTTICNFLDKQSFVSSYTLVIDNTQLTKGYLISVDVNGGSFIDFRHFINK